MPKKAKSKIPKPDGYRLRMICNRWYLRLEKDKKILRFLGPFTHKEAEIKAEKLKLPDHDRG